MTTQKLSCPTVARPKEYDNGDTRCLAPGTALPSAHLRDYLALSGSTTSFLEHRACARIGVQVLSQRIQWDAEHGDVLVRSSRLFLGTPDNTILTAEAEVRLNRLAPRQRELAAGGLVGLGRLLDPDSRDLLRKRDIALEWVAAPDTLGVGNRPALARSFYLLLSGTVCAWMRETLCDESLARLA